ncbi:MAG TPA: hypothetical protein VKT81_06480 [Bryobacteraceae bacterium]|nr:hypothetical protein [Bryobacteraceae bacterium]
MRQLLPALLSIGALAAFAETPSTDPSQSIVNKRIELAQAEIEKITTLVAAGSLPKLRLQQAEQDLADVQDDAVLARTLYGELPVENLNQQLIDDMVAAAQRRVERQQSRVDAAMKLVDEGITAKSSLEAPQQELAERRMNLDLAHSRAHLMGELAALSKYEKANAEIQAATRVDYRDMFGPGMEHYEGSGSFTESRDLKPLAVAFKKKFDHPLPISAEGETDLHRALGFDHSGRVDVAVNPSDPEGVWLRRYLKSRQIPYYAFTRAIPGKATAAHIHIGTGSTRLHNAD